jgi:hypothetical protein
VAEEQRAHEIFIVVGIVGGLELASRWATNWAKRIARISP